jgi:5S rRNA maturation endonuclease (ribonuclease M5)
VSEPGSDEAFDEFLLLWQKLLAEADGSVVVVEGERDVRSLRRLGWSGPLRAIHRGGTLAETAERLAQLGRRVIVLTDLDSKGGELARRLRGFLGTSGLDLDYRRRLARVLRGELVHIEGLHGWARRNAERRGQLLEALVEADGPAGAPVRG